MKIWPSKDPQEVLDYGFDWSPRDIDGDTIEEFTATVTKGDMVVDSATVSAIAGVPTGQGTIVWLSGGTHNVEANVLLHVVTAAGRVLEETMRVPCKNR